MFVIGMETDRRKHQIVRSTIQLGHNLGLRVVAEGVENEIVQEQLQELGCDVLQGYHIGRPMSADLVGARLRHSQTQLPPRLLRPRAKRPKAGLSPSGGRDRLIYNLRRPEHQFRPWPPASPGRFPS